MRWYPVWRRNMRVWQKLFVPSIISNFGEPLLYLVLLGYGLGRFIKDIDGMQYFTFLATGIICSSAMNTASFEGMYSAYTRMDVEKVWQAMITAPLGIRDVVLGEVIWGGSKSLLSSFGILTVASVAGYIKISGVIYALPMVVLIGCCFNAMALLITAFAKSYDFFLYYFTLVLTPTMLLSGVYFPLSSLPVFVQNIAKCLPLSHAVAIVRPVMVGREVSDPVLHLAVISMYTLVAYLMAVYFIRKRILK